MQEEIIISQEEQDELDIRSSNDMVTTVVRETGGFSNIVYISIESATLGKRVITIPQYEEDYVGQRLVSRRVVEHLKVSQSTSDSISIKGLSIK